MKQAAQSRGSRAPAPLGRSRCELLCRRRQLGPRPLTHTQLCVPAPTPPRPGPALASGTLQVVRQNLQAQGAVLSPSYLSTSSTCFLILCQPTGRKLSMPLHPGHLPPCQGETQVTCTGSVDTGTERGLEPQKPGSSCFGCVTLDTALPLSEPQFSHP